MQIMRIEPRPAVRARERSAAAIRFRARRSARASERVRWRAGEERVARKEPRR